VTTEEAIGHSLCYFKSSVFNQSGQKESWMKWVHVVYLDGHFKQ